MHTVAFNICCPRDFVSRTANVERLIYAHHFPPCRVKLLKWCPDGSASTAWDYADLLCNLYRDAGPKSCHYSQTSRAQFPLKPLYTWCHMLLTALHHSPGVGIPPLFPSNSSILPLHLFSLLPSLTCMRVTGNYHQKIMKTTLDWLEIFKLKVFLVHLSENSFVFTSGALWKPR